MISFQNVSKHFYHDNANFSALKNISFDVAEGEITGIIGKSGAGKSTLLRCVNGLESPDSGKVLVNNASVADLSGKNLRNMRKKTTMVFQHFNLLSAKTVFDNIAFPLYLNGQKRAEITDKVNQLLALTELESYKTKYPSQLSGGQKQRVAVARALISDPEVILCDEATSALDPQNTRSILQLLDKINRSLNKTILLVTHEMDVIKSICHRVILLDKGSLVESTNTLDFFLHPKTKLSEDFVGSNFETDILSALRKDNKHTPSSPILKIMLNLDEHENLLFPLFLKYQLIAHIVYAKVEFIRESRVGIFVFRLEGSPVNIQELMSHLKKTPIRCENITYAV